ncbi:hypothetical protein SCHIN_v1c05580 [Spiroplasma chinense]|uniref:MOLPALP family lipoprotein n=1 Tax=Spiroplasma chinense TaxID=216932 RepID=A0A5B9Y4M4_9MOLU|nr:lipoprotein [Spiroplasma chinense]QEH61755.1 hypothetical protein SCHIN_v1c05580 [Spiroplasma chinense]
MKKLLGILGAVSLSASASVSVVACSSQRPNLFNDEISQDTLSKLMSQYAKVLFINQNGAGDSGLHISPGEIFNSKIKSQYLDKLDLTKFDKSLEISDTTRFQELGSNYLNFDKLSSELSVSEDIYQNGVMSMESSAPDILKTLAENAPTLLSALANPSALAGILEKFDMSSLLSPDIAQVFGKVLTNENMQLIENAFSNEVYANMSMQQALDSSVIGLANALENLTNPSSGVWIEYTGFSDSNMSEQLEANYQKAIGSLSGVIGGLISGTKSINFDLIKNLPAIAEIIRFIRTLLVYLNQYTFDDYTNGIIKVNKVETVRSKKMQDVANEVDLKPLLQSLKYMVNDTDNNGAVVIKNLLAVVAGSVKTTNIQENYDGGHDGFADLLGNVVVNIAGMESISVNVSGLNLEINLKSVIRAVLNYCVGTSTGEGDWKSDSLMNNVIKAIFGLVNDPMIAETIPQQLLDLLIGISDAGDASKFSDDIIGYLWNQSDETIGFSIKTLLSTPMASIPSLLEPLLGGSSSESSKLGYDVSTSSEFDFILGKSIKDIVNDLSEAVDKSKNTKMDFDGLTKVIKAARKDDALVKGLSDLKNLFKYLGIEDGKVVAGSVLDELSKSVGTWDWLANVLEVLGKYMNSGSDLGKLASDALENISVTKIDKKGVNDFVYTVTDGEDILDRYEITLKPYKQKLIIDKITLVK